MSKLLKVLKTVGKIYGIVWIAENCFIAKGIELKKYYDLIEYYYTDNIDLTIAPLNARETILMASEAQVDCTKEALKGWKRQIGTTIDAVKMTLNKG